VLQFPQVSILSSKEDNYNKPGENFKSKDIFRLRNSEIKKSGEDISSKKT